METGQVRPEEAAEYFSEGFLPREEEQASFLDRLGDAAAGMETVGLFEEPAMPSRLSTAIYEGRPNSGSRALKRMGIASLA
jgi:hypothetical protein